VASPCPPPAQPKSCTQEGARLVRRPRARPAAEQAHRKDKRQSKAKGRGHHSACLRLARPATVSPWRRRAGPNDQVLLLGRPFGQVKQYVPPYLRVGRSDFISAVGDSMPCFSKAWSLHESHQYGRSRRDLHQRPRLDQALKGPDGDQGSGAYRVRGGRDGSLKRRPAHAGTKEVREFRRAPYSVHGVYWSATVQKVSRDAATVEEVREINDTASRQFPAQRSTGARH
jgi:hypothetical protein